MAAGPPRMGRYATEPNSGLSDALNALIPGGSEGEQQDLAKWTADWQDEPGYRYAENPLIPMRQKVLDEQGNLGEPELAWPGAIRQPIQALLDTFQGFRTGTVKPETIQTIAGLSIDPMAPMTPGRLGMYAGFRGSKDQLTFMERALKLADAGTPMEQIRKDTGWFRGADGEWRFEIPDKDAQLKPENIPAFGKTTLGQIMDHPKLYAAYPELKDLPVEFKAPHEMGPGVQGQMNYGNGQLELRDNLAFGDLRSIALHEIQHTIQKKEGFARGGSPSWMENQLGANPDTAYEIYHNLLGEKEARDVQWRANLGPDKLAAMSPAAMEGTAHARAPGDWPVAYGPDWAPYTMLPESKSTPTPTGAGPNSAMTDPVYHGTPHEIEGGFSDDKIGTGEGAQAFGWGHYVAGRQGVAKSYQEKLSKGAGAKIYDANGKELQGDAARVARNMYDAHSFLGNAAQASARDAVKQRVQSDEAHIAAQKKNGFYEPEEIAKMEAELAPWKEAADALEHGTVGNGNLYTAKIHPEEDELLHRDLPLGEQPKVLAAIQKGEAEGKLPPVQNPGEPVGAIHYYKMEPTEPSVEPQSLYSFSLMDANGRGMHDHMLGEFHTDDLGDGLTAEQVRQAFPPHLAEKILNHEGFEGRHFDAPPSQQRSLLLRDNSLVARNSNHEGPLSGAEYYDNLTRALGEPKATSKALDAAGVPGLRFHDQNSRTNAQRLIDAKAAIETRTKERAALEHDLAIASSGPAEEIDHAHVAYLKRALQDNQSRIDGNKTVIDTLSKPDAITHNYVLFDPRHITLTHKNGTLLRPHEGDPFGDKK